MWSRELVKLMPREEGSAALCWLWSSQGASNKRSGPFLERGKGKKAVFPVEPQERKAALPVPWWNPGRALWDFRRLRQWVHTCLLLLAMNDSIKRKLNVIQTSLLFGLQLIKFWCKSLVVFSFLSIRVPCDPCSYTEETFSESLWVICLCESIQGVHA